MNFDNLDNFMTLLTNRYLGLLSREQINSLFSVKILIAGCGIGSAIAEEAARMGFCHFILVDKDAVSPENLGRQRYTFDMIGQNKAEALRVTILRINPFAVVEAIPEFVTLQNANALVAKADIIVDAIDPEAPLEIVALHRAARSSNKPVLLPVDTGWGAKLFVFTKDSFSYDELLGIDPDISAEDLSAEDIFGKTWSYFSTISPVYVQNIVEEISSGRLEHYPQPSSASAIAAGLCITAMKKLVLGEQVILAPDHTGYDPN